MSFIALTGNPSQSYGASPAIWNHSVTCHPTQVNVPHLNPSQTGRYSIYLPRRDGMLTHFGGWVYSEMLYLFVDSHPSK